jgi:hypothetical protein
MPAFEILAEERAPESETPAVPRTTECKTRVRRLHAWGPKDHARLLLPFLCMAVLGVAGKLKYPYWWPAQDLISFVANAFMVAALIGVLLGLFSAKLLVERAADGLAQRLIGRGLPAELQAPIRDIVATELVRDHFVKSYAFSSPEEGYVDVEVEVRYEVRNYSEAVREYAPEIAVQILLKPEFRFLEYGIAGRKIHTFFDEKLLSKVEIVDELNVRRVSNSSLPRVTLKPFRAGERSPCHVTWRYRLIVPEQYCDLTEFGEATLGATLQVLNFPDELEFFSGGDASLHHEVSSQSWYFDRSFITGQHVLAWWCRKAFARQSAPWRDLTER